MIILNQWGNGNDYFDACSLSRDFPVPSWCRSSRGCRLPVDAGSCRECWHRGNNLIKKLFQNYQCRKCPNDRSLFFAGRIWWVAVAINPSTATVLNIYHSLPIIIRSSRNLPFRCGHRFLHQSQLSGISEAGILRIYIFDIASMIALLSGLTPRLPAFPVALSRGLRRQLKANALQD